MVSHQESLSPDSSSFPGRTCVRTFSRKGFPGPEYVDGSRKQTKEDYSLWHEFELQNTNQLEPPMLKIGKQIG